MTAQTISLLARLDPLRALPGSRWTQGLAEDQLVPFAEREDLQQAVTHAIEAYERLRDEVGDFFELDEREQITRSQAGIVNFYGADLVSPYVALGAAGPWIVTTKGAVIHDSGGYGMLGQGHTPAAPMQAMALPQVMANVMTPSLSQLRAVRALREEIGHRRDGPCPFDGGFVFMNSGSESVTIAARLADANAKVMTDPGGRYEGRPVRRLALRGSFHGRTHRPAMYSDSGFKTYASRMASFRDLAPLHVVIPNDVADLERTFAKAEEDKIFVEALFIEPVMGEGNPGVGVTRAFYDAARRLTREHGSLLLVDSIQAGLRTHGVLSIVDYPGFEDCEAPDLETYSKALNAGQYPMSVLAMTTRAADHLKPGLYGNTMTTNPRALDVATCVLEALTPELRANIVARGTEFKERLEALAAKSDGAITAVTGTGLLVAASLDPERFKSYGSGSIEEYLRTKGIGVIHGGDNALRFTPHFAVTSEELALVVDALGAALCHARPG